MSRNFKVTVNGREYDVSVLELTAGQPAPITAPATGVAGLATPAATTAPPAVPTQASAAAPSHAAGDIAAGMGGVIVEVHVTVGQTVAAGDRLLVIEAMKMKTPVIATHAGQITRLLVTPGLAVEGGQLLLTIA